MDEDGNDCRDGDSDQDLEVETDLLTRDWESRPRSLQDDHTADWDTGSESEVDIYMAEEEHVQEKWLKSDRDYEGDWEEEEEGDEEEEEDDEEEWDSSMSTEYLRALRGIFPLLQKGQQTNDNSWGSEPELEYLRDGESENSASSGAETVTHSTCPESLYFICSSKTDPASHSDHRASPLLNAYLKKHSFSPSFLF